MATENTDIIKKTLDILVVLNTAVKNIRLYPPASATVVNSLSRLYQSFLDALVLEEQIIFAESEKKILINGLPLNHKEQEKPPVASFLGIMMAFGVKSISFMRGLEKEELDYFIGLISQKPESVRNEGGFGKLLPEHNISHVILDQKVYVALDKNRQILANLDINDDEITRFLIMSHPDMNPDSPQLKELVKDPMALAETFKTGLSQMIAQKETLSGFQISENVNHMLWLLDKLSGGFDDKNRGILSQNIGQALMTTDQTMARHLTTQNMEHLMGGLLLQYLTNELTQNKNEGAGPGGRGGAASTFPASGESDTPGEQEISVATNGESRVMQVAKKYILHIQDDRTLLDKSLMSVLSKIVEELLAQKEQETMKTMIQRLAENLTNQNNEIRSSAAKGLADIIDHLPGELVNETVNSISPYLIAWVKTEHIFSPEYQRICLILKNIAQTHLDRKQYAQSLTYLDAFNANMSATIKKAPAVKNASLEMIEQLASPENISSLLNEIDLPENRSRRDIGQVFAALGDSAFNQLLDQLRETTDSNERVRIMRLIMSAKDRVLPLIVARFKKNEPWYYLRNLAYMLGQIGNEESARVLAPLLLHENFKLHHEALKSIYRTGGNLRGKLLLSALPQADDEFKASIVESLGQSKATDAVDSLLLLLKDHPLVPSSARLALEEKICAALGAIGSPDAIPFLSDISETKSFLGLRSYPDRVKAAAANALVVLRRKAAESGRTTGLNS